MGIREGNVEAYHYVACHVGLLVWQVVPYVSQLILCTLRQDAHEHVQYEDDVFQKIQRHWNINSVVCSA